MRGRERIPGIPVVSQEEALSTGKARGTPGSCHHSQSPPDVSVHSRETCFPCTTSTFKPRIDSHHGGTWNSPVGKPRGKAWWESLMGKPRGKATDPLIQAKGSVTVLLQLGRKAAGALELLPGPQGPALVASGKSSLHASCSGASRDSSSVDAGAYDLVWSRPLSLRIPLQC